MNPSKGRISLFSTRALEEVFLKKGYKVTRHRRAILDIFLRNNVRWVTANEIHELIKNRNYNIDFSTVYRNLEMMAELGILCKMENGEGSSGYFLNRHEDHHHHHIICKSCGRTCKIDFCPLEKLDDEELQDFYIVEHKFEIYGYCRECRDVNHREKKALSAP